MSTTISGNRTWMDRIRSAFTAQDETMLAAALAEAPTPGAAGGTVVHLHTGTAQSTKDEAAPMSKDVSDLVRTTADALGLMNASLKALDTRFTDLDRKVAGIITKDGEREDAAVEDAKIKLAEALAAKEKADKEEAEAGEATKAATGDAATRDSASLAAAFQDCMSRAEILMPGIAIPTFDASTLATSTEAVLCGFRRKVLTAAQAAGPGQAHVKAVLPVGADLAGMTCDAVGIVFQGATELARSANNTQTRFGRAGIVSSGKPSGAPPTPTEINERNRKFYGG